MTAETGNATSTDAGAEPAVLTRREGAVEIVTFNRPAVLNAMTGAMSAGYAGALRAADADPQVRVVVVTGAGRGFCAGADLGILTEGADHIRQFLPRREELPTVAFRIRKPVICAVNGPVAGVGFAYMMASDIRFAAAEAKISTTFARLGLVAEYGLSWLLPRVMGTAWTLDLLLSARTITGEEAGRIGLVQYVSPRETVLADAVAYATRLAQTCSPFSMAAVKAQVYADLEATDEDALTRTLALMSTSFDHPDLAAALAARADQTSPEFPPLPPGPGQG
jgi:enoyl-CoA hydratase/carnithine racemase